MYGRKYDFEGYIDNIHVNAMCQYYIHIPKTVQISLSSSD